MKASKRRRRADRTSSKPVIEAPPAQPAFSADEEAFFREGAELSAAASAGSIETFADLDAGVAPRPSLWRRLFARSERHLAVPGSLADA